MGIRLYKDSSEEGHFGREYFFSKKGKDKFWYCVDLDNTFYSCSQSLEPSHEVDKAKFEFPCAKKMSEFMEKLNMLSKKCDDTMNDFENCHDDTRMEKHAVFRKAMTKWRNFEEGIRKI